MGPLCEVLIFSACSEDSEELRILSTGQEILSTSQDQTQREGVGLRNTSQHLAGWVRTAFFVCLAAIQLYGQHGLKKKKKEHKNSCVVF